MKNLLLLGALLFCAYLYKHPRVETRVELAPVVDVVPAATPRPRPRPTPEPKLYYHSPLDGPTATNVVPAGYFSNDPAESTGQHLSGSSNGSSPSYYNPYYSSYGGSGTVNNTVIINNGSTRPGTVTSTYPPALPSKYVPAPRSRPPTPPARSLVPPEN